MSSFHVLPTRTARAAEAMATDFLLLQRYPEPDAVRFRHYGWPGPAFTFGYSQKIEWVRGQLATILAPAEEAARVDLCRRPTGGGIVDHRDDWTFSLVIPRGHALEDARAAQSYRAVHEALAAALVMQGVRAELKTGQASQAEGDGGNLPGVCFQRAEEFDVIDATSRSKIAGAAQKRNKRGLLFQGSVWRPAVDPPGNRFDWEKFPGDFAAELGKVVGLAPETTPWPELDDDEVSGLVEQYSSPEWIEYR